MSTGSCVVSLPSHRSPSRRLRARGALAAAAGFLATAVLGAGFLGAVWPSTAAADPWRHRVQLVDDDHHRHGRHRGHDRRHAWGSGQHHRHDRHHGGWARGWRGQHGWHAPRHHAAPRYAPSPPRSYGRAFRRHPDAHSHSHSGWSGGWGWARRHR